MAHDQDRDSIASTPSQHSVKSRPSETTPLLQKEPQNVAAEARPASSTNVILRVLFTSFVASIAWSITQVPLLYVFGIMSCEEYYKSHRDPGDVPERCKVTAIEANTAQQISIMAMSTTLFGVMNLFVTGWNMKRYGINAALLTSIVVPGVRLVIQTLGVFTGGAWGIFIVQASQAVTIFGGPLGYLLALNSYATEIVSAAERTKVLGRLQGIAFFGNSIGVLVGGLIGDINIAFPFVTAFCMFFVTTVFIAMFLPRLKNNATPEQLQKTTSLSAFFEPLKLFVPRKWVLDDGRIQRQWGILWLGISAFLALLATGYIPVLLQMYATDVLNFGTAENGWLISLNNLVRGLFLTFAFPAIISAGRKVLARYQARQAQKLKESEPLLSSDVPASPPTNPQMLGAGPLDSDAAREPILPPHTKSDTDESSPRPNDEPESSFQFDLLYARYSIILDGALTSLAYFTSSPAHLFLVAVLLPCAAGTGSAAKGTILQMCAPHERPDALAAISLVESMGRLAAAGVFGEVFALFAGMGEVKWTFVANGGVALIAGIGFLITRFPPPGAKRWMEGDEQEAEE